MKPEVLVLLSGGLDSYACLHFYRDAGRIPAALFVDYGQPAARDEEAAARSIASHLDVEIRLARWQYKKPKNTGLIRGRNAFLLTAALMECLPEISIVAIGVHDGTEYPDCSPTFIDKMQIIYDLYTGESVQVAAPFLTWGKNEVHAYSTENRLELGLAYSCEAGGIPPCGECLSCRDSEALAIHA